MEIDVSQRSPSHHDKEITKKKTNEEMQLEDGEITPEPDDNDASKKSHKKKKSDAERKIKKEKSKKKDKNKDKDKSKDKSRDINKSKEKIKSKSKSKNKDKVKDKKKDKEKSRSKEFYNLGDYDKPESERKRRKSVSPNRRKGLGFEKEKEKDTKSSIYHRRDDYYSHSDSYHRHNRSRSSRSHENDRKRRRSRSKSQSVVERVDKEKLLQIAKANLARMIKAGTLPKGFDIDNLNLQQLKNLKEQNSISQWSEYCRALSVMEAATNDDSGDSVIFFDSDDENSDTKSVCSTIIRHPFQLKERKDIQIKVRDFAPLPIRTSKEIQMELTEKFPVSCGNVHRIKELEWIEVKPAMPPPSEIPKKKEAPKRVFKEVKAPVEPTTSDKMDAFVSSSTSEQEMHPPATSSEIGTLVALKLSAKKKLQEDPLNLVAIRQIYEAERLLTLKIEEQATKAQSEQATKIGFQALRAGKQEFSDNNRIKDGIGMHLLLKMGWQPGQGLGKELKGPVEPIVPSLKFDTKGLISEEETVSKIPAQVVDLSSLAEGRNPISLLGEYCQQKKWPGPVYHVVEAAGPDHKKSFIMKVIVKDVEYRPSVSCGTKKQAKALAASIALQAFGLTANDEDDEMDEKEKRPDNH